MVFTVTCKVCSFNIPNATTNHLMKFVKSTRMCFHCSARFLRREDSVQLESALCVRFLEKSLGNTIEALGVKTEQAPFTFKLLPPKLSVLNPQHLIGKSGRMQCAGGPGCPNGSADGRLCLCWCKEFLSSGTHQSFAREASCSVCISLQLLCHSFPNL